MDTVMYLLMLYLCLLPLTSGQPVRNAQETLETVDRAAMVEQAEANMTNSVITLLPALPEAVAAEALEQLAIVRAPLGGLASFSCLTGLPELAQEVVWLYHNASFHSDALPQPPPKGHHYQQLSIADTSHFLIRNITAEAAGTVECWLPCGPKPQLCFVQGYDLVPKLRAHDVFTEPMRNVITPLPEFSMTCTGRVDCSRLGPSAHFIEVRRPVRGGSRFLPASHCRPLAHPRSAAKQR
ncbi:uncharacterized protein LOC129593220 [Paramacrobiotus metropolitanus]|uniref:uncharacterized protein LOC129593220 n=1 Tax=Paramacrobiotus metropolitanus TaxID=2943436 RepID=UPI002445B2F2|nr:uncharacterized protein LOC129593220 [Paramacrobiotus metropolitanus]